MTTFEFYTYQEQTFDSYCKRLIRNESADAHKELARRARREVTFSAAAPSELARLAHEDNYPPEPVILSVKGSCVAVNDLTLGQALLSLPPKWRDVILLFYFLGKSDPQIGAILHLTPSAIHYRRTVALERLKQILEVMGREC